MLKFQNLIFFILTLSILSIYAVKAVNEIEERRELSLEGKLAFTAILWIGLSFDFNLF